MVLKFELPSALLLAALCVPSLMAFSSGCTTQINDTAPDSSDSSESGIDTADGDVVWHSIRIETSATLNGITADNTAIYVVGSEGKLWNYNSLTGWATVTTEVDDEDLHAVWSPGTKPGFMAVGNAGWVVYFNGATLEYTDLGTTNFLDVTGTSWNNVFAVGWGGPWHFDGKEWDNEVLPDASRLNALWCSADAVFGVGEDGAIEFRLAETWAAQLSPTNKALHDVSGTSDSDVWAVGEDGTVIHWDGKFWEDKTPKDDVGDPKYTTFWAVWAAGPTSVYAVGNNGTAIHYNGTEWKELPTGVDNILYAIHGVNETDVWVAGNKGAVLHYYVE